MPLDKAKAIEVLLDIVKGTIEVDWITEVIYTPPVPGQPPPDPVRLLNNLTGLAILRKYANPDGDGMALYRWIDQIFIRFYGKTLNELMTMEIEPY